MIINSAKKAKELLLSENIVGIPTETVYGLAALATSDIAVSQIYNLKQRPTFNPLIVHIHDFSQIDTFATYSSEAKSCCEYFWNLAKPLTVVLSLKKDHPLSNLVTAGLDTVAVRRPNHALALDIIKSVGPLAAPSANVSNSLSPTKAEHVEQSFKENAPFILDGGTCTVGIESTILDLSNNTLTLLRPGGLSIEDLEDYFKGAIKQQQPDKITAPGQMKLHYSPGCPVYLNQTSASHGQLLLGFGPNAPKETYFNLSQTGNLTEAACNLFDALYQLALLKPSSIAIMPIPDEGLGLAINDRLKRAASI